MQRLNTGRVLVFANPRNLAHRVVHRNSREIICHVTEIAQPISKILEQTLLLFFVVRFLVGKPGWQDLGEWNLV